MILRICTYLKERSDWDPVTTLSVAASASSSRCIHTKLALCLPPRRLPRAPPPLFPPPKTATRLYLKNKLPARDDINIDSLDFNPHEIAVAQVWHPSTAPSIPVFGWSAIVAP